MKVGLVAFLCGVVFSLGLGLAGMTQPSKVVGFLDFFGHWDPSLALVMVGAIGVNAIVFQVARRWQKAPLLTQTFHVPTRTDINGRLIGGAVLFGVGWGLGGYCPGPAITSLAGLSTSSALFVGCMVVGMWVFQVVDRRLLPPGR